MSGACNSVNQPLYSATGISGPCERRRTDAFGSNRRSASAHIFRNRQSANTENFVAGRSKSRIAAVQKPPCRVDQSAPWLPRPSAAQRIGVALTDITNVAPDRKPKANMPLTSGGTERQALEETGGVLDQGKRGEQSANSVRKMGKAVLPPATSPTYQDCNPLERDPSNVQNVSEYTVEIIDLLFIAEEAFLVRASYMEEVQRDINAKMRAILIDWLIEVHMTYRLRNETLFLAINLLDRYLALEPVARQRLQLVGVVAMFVAAKFEEIMPPEVHEFVYVMDHAYTKSDILALECTMLTALSFQIAVPTSAHFLEFLQHANSCDDTHRDLAQYFLELALLDLRMIRFPPSHLTAAALLLSNELMGRRQVWPLQMARHSRHTEAELKTCVTDLRNLWESANSSQLQALRKKYALPEHFSVARIIFGTS